MSAPKDILLQKLEAFIKRYYKNQLLKGALLATAGLCGAFLFAVFLEYIGRFGSITRALLFWGYLLFALLVLFRFVLKPLLGLYKIGKIISFEQAASIIGNYFPGVGDKLLNTLQLREMAKDKPNTENELLLAGIEQKTKELQPFPFIQAINLKTSLRYARYAAIPLSLILIITIFQSNILKEGAERLVHYGKHFEEPAPFKFIVDTEKLKVLRSDDVDIEVFVEGTELPASVTLNLSGQNVKMEKRNKTTFFFTLKNVQQTQNIYFQSAQFRSADYELIVIAKPLVTNMKVELHYPAYTGRKYETLENTGDLTIPQGTTVKWKIATKDADNVQLLLDSTDKLVPTKGMNSFHFEKKIIRSQAYKLLLENNSVAESGSIDYNIHVVRDEHPSISVDFSKDSTSLKRIYYFGKASDDYGLRKIQMVYTIYKEDGTTTKGQVAVKSGNGRDETFYYVFHFDDFDLLPSDKMEYYFEAWDNDAINGSKSSRTTVFKTDVPSEKELASMVANQNESLKNKLSQAMIRAKQLQKKSEELQRSLLESKTFNWEQQQKLEDLLKEQQKLEQEIKQIQEELKSNQEKQNEFNKPDEELLKKQQEINRLFEEILDDKTKEMLKNLQEMLKKNHSEELKNQLEKMRQQDKDLEKQMDRALEHLKQMEVEQQFEKNIEKLNELSKKMEELSQKIENKEGNKDELLKQMEELQKEWDDLKKSMEEMKEKNKELENPLEISDTKELEQQIDNELKQSEEALKNKNNKNAAGHQKNASDKMEEMAEKLEEEKEDAESDQDAEDYQTLRQILENLLVLSKEQEEILEQYKTLNADNPKFKELAQRQKKLKDDMKMVEDSLFALSKRQIQIKAFVTREIAAINNHLDLSLKEAAKGSMERNNRIVASRQQYAMTGINNLAVMLSEVLKNLQDNMNESKDKKSGSKSCNNPKNGQGGKKSKKPSISEIKKKQQGIQQSMQEMHDRIKSGQKPTSKEFSIIAAQQEALRRELEKLEKQLKEEGNTGVLGDLEKTKKMMEDIEKDLVNKNITQQTLDKQREILNRLWEHEKGEKEQEKEENREAEKAKEKDRKLPPSIEEYLKQKAKEQELIKTLPPELSPYYKQKVREYFINLEA